MYPAFDVGWQGLIPRQFFDTFYNERQKKLYDSSRPRIVPEHHCVKHVHDLFGTIHAKSDIFYGDLMMGSFVLS